MAHRWTKAMKAKASSTMKMTLAKKRLANALQNTLKPMEQAQTPVVDMRKVEEYNYRRGLIAALDCIIRELR